LVDPCRRRHLSGRQAGRPCTPRSRLMHRRSMKGEARGAVAATPTAAAAVAASGGGGGGGAGNPFQSLLNKPKPPAGSTAGATGDGGGAAKENAQTGTKREGRPGE
ncbi:unnamed protein product, partial [Laminaria digitata]